MNAHIERLAREAGYIRGMKGDFYGDAPVIEAFARLIAEDCALTATAYVHGNGAAEAILERYK